MLGTPHARGACQVPNSQSPGRTVTDTRNAFRRLSLTPPLRAATHANPHVPISPFSAPHTVAVASSKHPLAFWRAHRDLLPGPHHARAPDPPLGAKNRTPESSETCSFGVRDNYARLAPLPGLSHCPPPIPSPPPPIPLVLVIASDSEVRGERHTAQLPRRFVLPSSSICELAASGSEEKLASGVRTEEPSSASVGSGWSREDKRGASPLLPVGSGSLWNTLTGTGRTSSLFGGVVSIQLYWVAFFPNTAVGKQEMNSLCSNYAHIFDMSSENISPIMGHLPVFLKRSVLLTGSAILTIAIRYRALLDRWILQKCAISQGAHVHSTLMLRSCWQRRSLPLFVVIGVIMARLYSYITIHSHNYNRQVIRGIEANIQRDSIIESNELCNQQSGLPSLLGTKHDYVRLLLHCICSTAIFKVHAAPKVISFSERCIQKSYDISSLRSIVARNGQYLTYIGAMVTLQIFLQINRVNTTTSLLPMLLQTTSSRSKAAIVSNMVIILGNSCGILGSAFTTKQHGRAATLTVSFVLMVFCQMVIPLIVEFRFGLGGGSRMPRGYATAMFLLTCVVSCGLSWSWGSMFWIFPCKKVYSAGQLLGTALNFALCFAQMQYFLMMLWRLKNATLAYYAMWIWS